MKPFLTFLGLMSLSVRLWAGDCESQIRFIEEISPDLSPEERAQLREDCLAKRSLEEALRSSARGSIVSEEEGFVCRIGNYEIDSGFLGTLGSIALEAQSSPFWPSTVADFQTKEIETYLNRFDALAKDSIAEQEVINQTLAKDEADLSQALTDFVDQESGEKESQRLRRHEEIWGRLHSQIETNEIGQTTFPSETETDGKDYFFNEDQVKAAFREMVRDQKFDELHAEVRVQIKEALTVLDLGLDKSPFGQQVLNTFGTSFSEMFFTPESYEAQYQSNNPCGFASFAAQRISLEAMDQYHAGNTAKAKEMFTLAGDLFTSFCPGVNDARDLAEFVTGKDMVTGQVLTKFERSLALVGLVIGGSGANYRRMSKYFSQLLEGDLARGLNTWRLLRHSGDIKLYDRLNPGPLHSMHFRDTAKPIATSFERTRYVESQGAQPLRYFRYTDENGVDSIDKLGRFWTPNWYGDPRTAQRSLGLNPTANPATHWIEIEVPAPVRRFDGPAAHHPEFGGGDWQTFFEEVKPEWIVRKGKFNP